MIVIELIFEGHDNCHRKQHTDLEDRSICKGASQLYSEDRTLNMTNQQPTEQPI